MESDGMWVDSWSEKENLPSLIKIEIKLDQPGFWPEMVFALKLAAIEPELTLDLE